MSTKVGLVQINNSFVDACYFPYSVGVLQAYFQKYSKIADNFDFLDIIYNRMPIVQIVERLREAKIVGLSIYVWNYNISLAIARKLKELDPDMLIIVGGPHVPDNADFFLRQHPYIDIACHGEGEVAFLKILEHYSMKNWKEIPSISYLEQDVFIHNPLAERIRDLSIIPSPYIEGVFDRLIKKNLTHQWLGLWETNRGCPFSCAYCDWGSATHHRLSEFDIARIKNEVEWFAENKIEFIFCCDSNYGIMKRDIDITRFVCDIKKIFGYPNALSVQNTKNATERSYLIQKMLSESGLSKGVNLALQTVDKTTLKMIGRHNISLSSFNELQKRFNQDRIETFTDIILALPGETYDSFTNGVSEIIKNGQHHRIQFINLSVLPNAEMGKPSYQKEHGLEIVETKIVNIHGVETGAEDGIYETQELVIGTNTMDREDWVKARVFSWMTSFLYFDKLLQIPFILLHEICELSYRECIELFLGELVDNYPIISKINAFFINEARNIQQGGAEYCKSSEWLNIYWPHDEYILIKLCIENEIETFYKESENLIITGLTNKGITIPPFLCEALLLNKNLLKRPFQDKDVVLNMSYNIWNFYQSVLTDRKCEIKKDAYVYYVDRTNEAWHTWGDWCREVIWYGNKRGVYLYKLHSE